MSDAPGGLAHPPRRHRRLWMFLGVMLVLALAWVAVAGRVLVATDPVGEPEIVFALSGDPLGDRLRRAIGVAASTGARLVVFVDGGPVPETPAQIRRRAQRAGVPDDAIRFIDGVTSTAEEAGFAAGLLGRCDWSDAVVVTSPSHTRRAGFTFRRAIGEAATVAVVASASDFDTATWWSAATGRRSVFLEWVKGIGSLRYVVSPPPKIESTTPC